MRISNFFSCRIDTARGRSAGAGWLWLSSHMASGAGVRGLFALFLACTLAACQTTAGGRGASAGMARVDLTSKSWFPPIVRQQGNSCAQQAGLYYLLTAERNRERGLSSWQAANRLSPYQTYAILADSLTGNTHVTDGWHLARETGVPLETDLPRARRSLMHGFDKYVRATRQRPASWQVLPLRSPSDLIAVKDQLAAGHPLACDFQIRGAKLSKRSDGSTLVSAWGRTGTGHTMVYAGYDDTIGHDCNGDGQITNDRDITGDGRITLADYERGAFLVVNPWGPRWGTAGKAWALVREHAVARWPRAGEVARVHPARDSPPRFMLRLSLYLKERSHLLITASDGSSTVSPVPFRAKVLATSPGPASAWEIFGKVHRPGPPLSAGPLANPAGGPLEMGLDLTPLTPSSRLSLTLSTNGPPLQGTLHTAAFVELDSSGRILKETPLPQLPVILPPQGQTWFLAP